MAKQKNSSENSEKKKIKDVSDIAKAVEKGKLTKIIDALPEIELKKLPKKDRLELAVDILKEDLGFDINAYNKSRKYKLKRAAEYLEKKYIIRNNQDTVEIEIVHKDDPEKKVLIMDDRLYRFIKTELDMQGIELSDDLYKNLLSSGYFFESYNPLKEFIFSLPVWDGTTDHIFRWLQQVTLEDEKRWREYFVKGFKKWMVALVMSLIVDIPSRKYINQTCLIFQGEQGIYKSTFFESLIPEEMRLQYYLVGIYDFHKKEDQKYLGGKMIIDLEELSALTRADNEAVKTRITQPHFAARLPWGKADTRLKRRASFVGSTNDKSFLTDITGDRRFFCVPVKGIDLDDRLDIRDVYSQAFALYKSGHPWWFDNEDILKIGEMNEDFRVMSQEEEYILKHYSKPKKKEVDEGATYIQYLMTSSIAQWLCEKYKRLNDNNTVKRNLGRALTKHGFNKVTRKVNGVPLKLWEVIQHDDPYIVPMDTNKQENDDESII